MAAFTDFGFNYKMTDIHAAIGLSQMPSLRELVEERVSLAAEYTKRLASLGWLKPQATDPEDRSSYYSYIVRLSDDSPIERDALRDRLSEHGIGTSIMYQPIHSQPYYRQRFGDRFGPLPVSEKHGLRSLVLPLYNGVSTDDVETVVEGVRAAAG